MPHLLRIGNDILSQRPQPHLRSNAGCQRVRAPVLGILILATLSFGAMAQTGSNTSPPPAHARFATNLVAEAPTQRGAAAGLLSARSNDSVSLQKIEADYLARLDKLIQPIMDYDISAADAENTGDAVRALAKGDEKKAATLKDKVRDPIGRKLIDWYRLRKGYGDAAEIRVFLDRNPDWPDRSLLWQRLEEDLFTNGGSAIAIKAYFKDGEPQTPAGLAALASVHLANGDKEKARQVAASVWREQDLAVEFERGFLARFGSLLTEDDHKWRLDRLLIDDVRWKSGRKQRAAQARRVIALLSAAEQKKAKARLSVFLRSRVSTSRLKANSTDWGLQFHRVQVLRRANKTDKAAKLLLSAPTDPEEIANLDEWWTERQKLAYQALRVNKPKLAYELVRDAGPLSVNPLNQQSFMAGWIALRYLKDPAAAEKHFGSYCKTADGPLGRAKAHYWYARTMEAMGNTEKARKYYRIATRDGDTFHGLLATQKLEPGRNWLSVQPPADPTPAQLTRFTNMDAVKAITVAKKGKLSQHIRLNFFRHLQTLGHDEGWSALLAHLARETGDTQTSLRIGKWAIARGQNLIYYSYPVHALPKYKPLRTPPETAFLLGLARQETEFNPGIVSGAGARGILQVMKGTARHVCRVHKVKCSNKRLLTDSSYNTMIASAYVGDRLSDFSGSYILGLVSYNAGPGRARQWIREFGDPRSAKVDPIDWIERIPIKETRLYVAKVLSNIQVYRARLGQHASALRIHEDLSRAREASLVPHQKKSGKTDTAKSGG